MIYRAMAFLPAGGIGATKVVNLRFDRHRFFLRLQFGEGFKAARRVLFRRGVSVSAVILASRS